MLNKQPDKQLTVDHKMQLKHNALRLRQHKTSVAPTRVKLEPFLPTKSIVITTTNVMRPLMSLCCRLVPTDWPLLDSVVA